MYKYDSYFLAPRDENLVSEVLHLLFGEDPYCEHGMLGSMGVCKDCCDELCKDSEPKDNVVSFPVNKASL